jgi:spore germination protein GerM
MQDQQQVRRIPIGVVAGISAVMLVGGGGAAWLAWNSIMSSTTPPVPTASGSPQPVQPATEEKVQVYWLNDVNNRIEIVPSAITLKDTDKPSEILEGALKSLLTGPADPAFSTTIPKGTKLRNVSLEADGVHVDLSKEFTDGGGSASMTGRVAQVLYTASSLDPTAKVWIQVEGKPLEVLGGEGLMIDQPLTRENFEKNFDL